MRLLGKAMGVMIILLFLLEAFRYVLKFIFKKYGRWIKENTKFHPLLLKLMNLNKTIHPWVGYLTLVAIVTHVYIVTGFTWFNPSGVLAAALMSAEVIIGILGQFFLKKPRPKAWIWFHRLMPIVILVAIFMHISQF